MMPPVAEVAGGAALPHPKPRRLLLSLSPSLSLSPHFPLSLSSRDKSAPQLCLSPSGFLLPPQPSRRGAGRVGEVAPTPLSPSSFSSSSLPGKVRKAVATLQLLLHLFSSAGVGVRGVCACHFPRLCTIPAQSRSLKRSLSQYFCRHKPTLSKLLLPSLAFSQLDGESQNIPSLPKNCTDISSGCVCLCAGRGQGWMGG